MKSLDLSPSLQKLHTIFDKVHKDGHVQDASITHYFSQLELNGVEANEHDDGKMTKELQSFGLIEK